MRKRERRNKKDQHCYCCFFFLFVFNVKSVKKNPNRLIFAMFVKFLLMVFLVVFLTLTSIEFATAQLAWSSIIVDSESKYPYFPLFILILFI